MKIIDLNEQKNKPSNIQQTDSSSIIAESLDKVEHDVLAPAGYAEVKLSTQGRLGAPALFHIRNFKTNEIMQLSMTPDSELPARVLSILKDCIYEKSVDIDLFHNKEVEETLLNIYSIFYASKLENVPFPVNDSDYEWLKTHLSEKDATEKSNALKSGEWKPTVTIDLHKDVELYDVDQTLKPTIVLRNKAKTLEVKATYLRYSDYVKVTRWVESTFAEKVQQMEPLKLKIEKKIE